MSKSTTNSNFIAALRTLDSRKVDYLVNYEVDKLRLSISNFYQNLDWTVPDNDAINSGRLIFSLTIFSEYMVMEASRLAKAAPVNITNYQLFPIFDISTLRLLPSEKYPKSTLDFNPSTTLSLSFCPITENQVFQLRNSDPLQAVFLDLIAFIDFTHKLNVSKIPDIARATNDFTLLAEKLNADAKVARVEEAIFGCERMLGRVQDTELQHGPLSCEQQPVAIWTSSHHDITLSDSDDADITLPDVS